MAPSRPSGLGTWRSPWPTSKPAIASIRRSAGAEVESPFDQTAPGGIDLMLEGRTREDLDAYRQTLIAGGVQPDPIDEKRYFGHHIFKARDPDGNEVTISTSHASELPI